MDASTRSDAGPPEPPSETCGSVRLTNYVADNAGWCEFEYYTNRDRLPQLIRDGMTAAIAEPWNTSSYAGDPGEACGECWELDTINGTQIVMVTNLCPTEGNPLCAGSHFHLDIARTAVDAVGGGYLDEGQARRVPCPVDGDLRVVVNDENVRYMRVAFFNHRVPIRRVEFRGAGDGVVGPNEWTPVTRSGGGWEVLGGDTTTDRGGTGVQFRFTSAQGQVVESSVVVPSHPERGTVVDLGVQFDDSNPPSGGTCEFVPPGDVYIDGWGGIDEVRWNIDPWGEAESGFFGEVSDGCFEGSCIEVERLGQFTGFHVYYRQAFPSTTFSRATLRVRTRAGATNVAVAASLEGARCAERRIDVTDAWQTVELDLSACASLGSLNALTVDNGGERVALLLDDVRFVR
ncbi:MAG: expansin-like protein [Polyangiales bacterium]